MLTVLDQVILRAGRPRRAPARAPRPGHRASSLRNVPQRLVYVAPSSTPNRRPGVLKISEKTTVTKAVLQPATTSASAASRTGPRPRLTSLAEISDQPADPGVLLILIPDQTTSTLRPGEGMAGFPGDDVITAGKTTARAHLPDPSTEHLHLSFSASRSRSRTET